MRIVVPKPWRDNRVDELIFLEHPELHASHFGHFESYTIVTLDIVNQTQELGHSEGALGKMREVSSRSKQIL